MQHLSQQPMRASSGSRRLSPLREVSSRTVWDTLRLSKPDYFAMPQTSSAAVSAVEVVPVSLPLDTPREHPKVSEGMALLALSHTPIEHRLYEVMHTETIGLQLN